jgi:hypothetical protein
MPFSRRKFSKALLSNLPFATGAFSLLKPGLLAALAPLSEPLLSPMPEYAASANPSAVPVLGLNTWSLRNLKHDQAIPAILRVMEETGIRNCQLLSIHAEPEEFDPDFASMFSNAGKPPSQAERDAQKHKSEARAAWRASVPMTYFETLRSQFEDKGLIVRAYAASLGNSPEEIDRVFLMAKTLGVTMVITRLAETQTDIVAAAATRHDMLVGIQVSDQQILAKQLRASPQMRADPDLGDLTKAGVSALDFVKGHLDSICSIDLKDAVTGGGSVPFGTGDAHMKDTLEFLVHSRSNVDIYIDCDYPGTGSSTDEVKKCVRYVRAVIGKQ